MRLSLLKLTPLAALLAVVALGCDKPESPGEPASTSAMADQEARADFDGKLEVVVNAVEAAGEYSNLEVVLKNTTDNPITVANKDFRFAADSGDWFAAKDAPEHVTIAPGTSEKTTVSVAMPVAQLNLMTVGNIQKELPEAPDDSSTGAEAPTPSGEGIQKLEIPDDEKAN